MAQARGLCHTPGLSPSRLLCAKPLGSVLTALKSEESEAWCSWEIPQAGRPGSPVGLFHGVYSILLGSNPFPHPPPHHHPTSELPWWVNGLLDAPQTLLHGGAVLPSLAFPRASPV